MIQNMQLGSVSGSVTSSVLGSPFVMSPDQLSPTDSPGNSTPPAGMSNVHQFISCLASFNCPLQSSVICSAAVCKACFCIFVMHSGNSKADLLTVMKLFNYLASISFSGNFNNLGLLDQVPNKFCIVQGSYSVYYSSTQI